MEDDFVSLAFFFLFGVAVLFGLVRIMHGDGSLLFKRLGDFVDDVGFEKVKVQLGLSARVEGDPRTLHSTFSSLVLYP